jgi:hypothetical protein
MYLLTIQPSFDSGNQLEVRKIKRNIWKWKAFSNMICIDLITVTDKDIQRQENDKLSRTKMLW